MERRTTPAIILGIAFMASAWILGYHWVEARSTQRYVTVKGLSERSVKADQATWSIIGNYGARDTEEADRLIRKHERVVRAFMVRHGFEEAEMQTDQINVFRNNYANAVDPYNVQIQLTLHTDNIAGVENATNDVSELIAEGIVLSGDKWQAGPRYFFTNFQDLKPEMLAEATLNAKVAADEFARNSGSRVGKIKYANQGVFQILPGSRNNDQAEFYADKVFRVVTTVDYFLE